MTQPKPRIVVITGAAGRIGRATCLRFSAQPNAVVVPVDVDEAGLQSLCDLNGVDEPVVADLSRTSEVRRLIDYAVARQGRIDVLVNNAAIIEPGGTVLECTEELFDRTIAVNVRAPFFATKFAIPHMLAQGAGSIVNVASALGLVGMAGYSAYCVSKGAVVQLTRQVAADFAHKGIRCNAVCPGTITGPGDPEVDSHTAQFLASVRRLHPVERFGTPDEIATVIAFLASDDASFMHGAVVAVDGGFAAV